MESILFGTDTAANSIVRLMQQIGPIGAEYRDSESRVIGVVFPPQHLLAATAAMQEDWEFGSSAGTSKERRKGKTTQQLLETLDAIPLPPSPSSP